MSMTDPPHSMQWREFEAANRELNAFVAVLDSSESHSRQADLSKGSDVASGWWHGDDRVITVGVKDNIEVDGFALAAGLAVPVLRSDESVSGTWVKWLVRQGLVIAGKTNMYELGYGAPGCGLPPAVNPWDHSLIPGAVPAVRRRPSLRGCAVWPWVRMRLVRCGFRRSFAGLSPTSHPGHRIGTRMASGRVVFPPWMRSGSWPEAWTCWRGPFHPWA